MPLVITSKDAHILIRRCDMNQVISIDGRRPTSSDDGVQTFASEDDRRRLTPTALKAFVRIAQAWQLDNQESAALLGVSASTWDRIKAGRWEGTLSQDQLTRTSAVVGVYKGLKLLFADGMAERWPRLPNKNPLFNGRSAVEAMIEGGILMMVDVRRHVDAMRGGL
ncbi:antitoxin Xre-like helix-turn-helix domain-containing protein [Sphingomonas sp. 3-13AW]|uniref:antitoxin Xre-like helix-turn-helix domain-containing protein n=1 Tax=Sphingomonas sp. 3-13AW TaxID=3050450 RepID=UPI003BB4B821